MLKNGQTHLKNIFKPCIFIHTYQVSTEPQLVPAQHVTDGIETKARYKICRWNAIFQGHTTNSCGALHDLVPLVQFKKRKKHPRKKFTFSEVAS